LSGKPGNIGEFDSSHGNVRQLTKSEEGNYCHGNCLLLTSHIATTPE